VQVIADRADHAFAGVEPDANLDRDAVRAPRLPGVPIDALPRRALSLNAAV
jgi:hypothetical protein